MSRRKHIIGARPTHRLDLNFSNGVKASLGDLGSATTTYTPTNRNRINEASVMEAVGANTARIEAAGLLNEGAAANLLFSTRTFTTAAGWTVGTNVTTSKTGIVGVDGVVGNGTRATENDAASNRTLSRDISKSTSDSTTYFQATLSFLKTSGAASFPGFGLNYVGVSSKVAEYVINTDAGTVTAKGTNSAANIGASITSEGSHWRVSVWATDNGANSTVTWYLYPAVNTDGSGTYAAATTGYVDVDAAMLTTGSIPSSYFAGAAAQGDVQNTGTLTVGKSYHIITTEADHFGAGVLADQYIIAAATTALDANNTVREHGTVRLSEAGTTVWTMLDSLKNIFSDAEGAATSEGAVVFQWTPGYAEASGTGTVGILGWNNSTSSGIYTTHGSDLKITDGTNTATVTKAWVANTTYTVVAYWSKTLDILNIGVLDAGSWTWGTEQAYDDAQPVGTNLVPFYGNEYPNHIGHVDFWNSAMTQSFFEGKY